MSVACVIGLGSMGFGAASSLLRRGFTVRGVDVRAEAREKLAAAGGTACATPAEGASGADAVFVFVVNAEQTDAVLFGDDGALGTLRPGAVVASCATVSPLYAKSLGARVSERGFVPLDAPVSGGPARAAAGEMTIMGAGSAAAFEAVQPMLDAMAAKVYRLGEAPGAGSRVKMINQLLAGVHIASACEAMAFGMRNGVDPQVLYEVITASAGTSWMFQNRVPHILDGDYSPSSAVDIFVKDLGIVLETGRALTFPLPVASVAHQLFTAASAHGLGREDDAAVIKVYAEMAGLALPEKKKAP